MEKKTTEVDKAGVQTTEFWVAMVAPVVVPIIMVMVNKYGFPITEEAVSAMVIGVILPSVAYIFNRGWAKKKVADVQIATLKVESQKLELKGLQNETK